MNNTKELPITHELKTWPKYFKAIREGKKQFEVRKDDREFKVNDLLLLKEYNPKSGKYSGAYLKVRVTYILKGGDFGIQEGFCVMSFQ